MKKVISLLLVLLLLLPMIVACTPKTPEVPDDPDPGKQETPGGEEDKPPVPQINESPNRINDEETFEFCDVDLTVNNENLDKSYIFRDMSSASNLYRFCDKNAYMIYHFNIRTLYEPKITMTLANNYVIEISPDHKTWTKVYDWLENNPVCRDTSNKSEYTIDPYDYDVFDQCYIRLSDSDPSDGHGACISHLSFRYYVKVQNANYNIFDLSEEDYQMINQLIDTYDPSPVSTYVIHRDGGLIYNPISREKGTSKKYSNVDCFTGETSVSVGSKEITLRYKIPKEATAYDAVPIEYDISSTGKITNRIYVQATASEDAEKWKNTYYDLALPNKVDVKWDYLGYVVGKDNLSNRTIFSRDVGPNVRTGVYPEYEASPLTYSGTVPSSKTNSLMWLKFKYTNTGDTVLDCDGNGTFCFEGILYHQNGSAWEEYAKLGNLYNRVIDTVYPGDSGEMYFPFNAVPAGTYKLVINGLVRNETSHPENYFKNIWGGETYTSSALTFDVSDNASVTTPNKVVTEVANHAATRNSWLHRYEEFMASYDSLLKGISTGETISDTMYLQCAPWTNQIVLRLIVGDGNSMSAVSVPVSIETDSIKIKFNPNNQNYVVLDDGTRFPAISAQSMADMRGNTQLGPDAAANVIGNLAAMKDCGVNLINTTAAFEFDGGYGKSIATNTDACWFSLDVARLLGLKTEGWICYPYNSDRELAQANDLYGLKLSGTSFGSQDLARANGLSALWQYLRWGDNYWIGGKETVVLDVEDTRGWMRVDYNARAPMSDSSKNNFRMFLKDLYQTIDALNDDWGTDYTAFNQIDPEVGTEVDHGYKSYKSEDITFAEWSRPLAVLDIFRTLERTKDYKMTLDAMKDTIPTAKINVRTEGANWMVPVDPETDNSHLRHVYYSQRRCGIIPELMVGSETVYAHSDYTTLPYTPSEVAELTQTSVESGIIPMLLPQFNRMRDIAVNQVYGTDFSYEYNLTGAVKGAYINTVCSVFEWFRATYENGGVPGILWQDYLCDGVATATQRKEIAFFTEKLKEALDTPEGRKWATEFTQDTSVLAASKGLYSFNKDDVQKLIDEYRKK